MVMIPHAGYFDAAGETSKRKEKLLTVAGAVAPVGAWIKFERDWKRILEREGVSGFHATDFAASGGEFTGWKGDKPRRANFLHDLGIAFRNAASRLFPISVEVDAWNAVNAEYLLEETFHSPYALAGFTIILAVKKWRSDIAATQPIEFFFEDGDDGWDGLVKLCAPEDVVPIRLPKAKAIQFEAADLLAWKNRIACLNALKHQPVAGQSLKETASGLNRVLGELKSLAKVLVCPGESLVYGEEKLRKTCADSKVPLRSSIRPTAPTR
jgi:hypothetical protein